MTKYSYTLESTKDGVEVAEIHEFIEAKDIADAYGKTLSVVAKLNKKNADYVWILKNIENAYFVGCDCNKTVTVEDVAE